MRVITTHWEVGSSILVRAEDTRATRRSFKVLEEPERGRIGNGKGGKETKQHAIFSHSFSKYWLAIPFFQPFFPIFFTPSWFHTQFILASVRALIASWAKFEGGTLRHFFGIALGWIDGVSSLPSQRRLPHHCSRWWSFSWWCCWWSWFSS